MKRKTINIKIIATILCCSMTVGNLTGCQASSSAKTLEKGKSVASEHSEVPPLRANYIAQAEELKKSYEQSQTDQEVGLKYAQTLFALGEFVQSEEILSPLIHVAKPLPDAIYLSAQINYLNGNYAEAESQYQYLKENHFKEFSAQADAGLQMIYYQTNEYSKANQLFAGQDIENPLLDMMKAFDETPYQLNWNGNEQTTIPFVTTDPLPVIPIEINGVKMNAFIDTGAPMLLINESIASDLGIESISNDEGSGGGGSANIAFGKTGSLKLGEVDISNIPVALIPFDGFKNTFNGYATDVHAIIGTNILQQFVPIMDYSSGRLVLLPRNEVGHKLLNEMMSNEKMRKEVPFVLASTHYMFAKGSINSYSGLNMFVDSGLGDHMNAGIILSKNTMDLLEIPFPELIPIAEGQGGLGGSDYENAWFDLDSYGLSSLQLKAGTGSYSTDDVLSPFIDEIGFIGDALISHNYLKKYKWIINFDDRTMTFCE